MSTDICSNDYAQVNAVLWPQINKTSVWLFVNQTMFAFNLVTRKTSSAMDIEEKFPGVKELSSNITGASSSFIFEKSNSTYMFYTYLVFGLKVVVNRHFLDKSCRTEGINCELSIGELVDSFDITCVIEGPVKCFMVTKYMIPKKEANNAKRNYFFFRNIDTNSFAFTPGLCPTGITSGGVYRKTAVKDPCILGDSALSESKLLDEQTLLAENCEAIDLPMFEVTNFERFMPYDTNIFLVGRHHVSFKYNSRDLVTLTMNEVLGCRPPLAPVFDFYMTANLMLLGIFVAFVMGLSTILVKDLHRLSDTQNKRKSHTDTDHHTGNQSPEGNQAQEPSHQRPRSSEGFKSTFETPKHELGKRPDFLAAVANKVTKTAELQPESTKQASKSSSSPMKTDDKAKGSVRQERKKASEGSHGKSIQSTGSLSAGSKSSKGSKSSGSERSVSLGENTETKKTTKAKSQTPPLKK